MKVIQYGCGKMAKYTMRYVLENGWDIVGAVDINPNVIGKDISEVIGCENVGVKITSVEDADALFNEVEADVCIVTTMGNPLDKSSLISELTIPEAEEFLQSGNVGGGMLPKLQNCIDAIKAGVSRVHILDGRIEHCLLLEFFTDKGIGTAIIGESEEKYFSGEAK